MKLQWMFIMCAGALLCFCNQRGAAQQLKLGGNPTLLDKSALLELNSDKQGLLLPRVSKAQLNATGALNGAADGMFVYVTDEASLYIKKGTWQKVADFSNITTAAVTSVGLSMPAQPLFTVSGSPVTSTGTLTATLNQQNPNVFFAGPASGTAPANPTFRSLVAADIPAGSSSYIQNNSTSAQTANFNISGNGELGGSLRLTSLATATPAAANSKVLSVNSSGDVIVTSNPAVNNWLLTGNTAVAAGSFLGTTDDVPMVIKSSNLSFLEFGKRSLLGLTQSYPGYTDGDQKVTYVRSALQFEAAGASFYKPMFYIDALGNFRMKGSSAGTDFFEFGATGTSNNGGFEFIIGDDGDEPIIFKSYNYSGPITTEIMRLQSGKVGIGLTGLPARMLHVNGNMRLTGSAGVPENIIGRDATGDINNVAINANTLKITSGTLSANNNSAVWNASQINGVNISTTAPATNQVLQYNGTSWTPAMMSYPIRVINATTTTVDLGDFDYTVVITTILNTTVNLPSPSTYQGRIYTVKRINGAAITVTTPSGNIDGVAGPFAFPNSGNKRCFTFQSDGTNWYILSENN